MEYISAEEFLKKSEEVQDVLKDWCEVNLTEKDWIYFQSAKDSFWIDSVLDTRKDNIDVGRVFYVGTSIAWCSIHDPDLIPLLTEGQLRKFIEDITGNVFDTIYQYVNTQKDECKIRFDFYRHDGDNYFFVEDMYITSNKNYINALWQVACNIASEEVKYDKSSL